MKKTIVIGDGLTNAVLGRQHQFQGVKGNVGQREIERLLGKGRAFGEGPLPTFLHQATRDAGEVAVLLLQDAEAAGSEIETSSHESDPSSFVEPIRVMADAATVVRAAGDSIPWQAILEAVRELTGVDAAAATANGSAPRFLLVGCHTEERILAIAAFLKKILGFSDVAVSSHLVGSATLEAHQAALRYNLPGLGIRVFLDLEETATYVGIDPRGLASLHAHPCAIGPDEALEALGEDRRRIVELLCLHWTRTELKPLAGGFSGSALFLADGWKGEAHTEPMVIKIDAFQQMRRELDGYYQVKDFFGKHVPTFGYPVTEGDSIGVGMELAAMEGSPQTLQDTFEEAETEEVVGHFMLRLEKALSLLSQKLYRNTSEQTCIAPYRTFGLHAEQQLTWLRENAAAVLGYVREAGTVEVQVDADQLAGMVRLVASNKDSVDTEVCLVHGDLNLANIICDEGNNIWFIDWTHSGQAPVELDFAKLESDVKFVMSKAFDIDDLARLQRFEEYLLAQRIPADVDGLPDSLKFAKWDLRFRKILGAVRRIRQQCFELKQSDDWLVYRIALLKVAMHTLSFDKRRDRGECDVPQLMHALYSVEQLAFNLVADDFHLKTRAERPPSYPPRKRIPIDEAPWVLDCPDYDPPYHVDPAVLANDRLTVPKGWADPEDVSQIQDELAARPAKRRDELGRPRNPRGRTGIAGRGLLGLWGRNLSVAATVIRRNEVTNEFEVVLGTWEDSTELALPKGFVLPTEKAEKCLGRVVAGETGWDPGSGQGEIVFEGYTYDPRQTDHAWVESRAYLLFDADGGFPDMGASSWSRAFRIPGAPGEPSEFDEVKWWPLDAATINRVPSGSAGFIRASIQTLMKSERMDTAFAEALLSKTG
jgi:ADP-ribose pyrophosphatase